MPHISSKNGGAQLLCHWLYAKFSQPHYKFADSFVVQSLLSLSDYMYPHHFLNVCHNWHASLFLIVPDAPTSITFQPDCPSLAFVDVVWQV